MPLKLKQLLDNYASAMHDGNAAIFMGAGMSRSYDFVDWKGLLRPYAKELGLNIKKECDLVELAQYYLNSKNREKSFLNRDLRRAFDKPGIYHPNHEIIARLPIQTIWTTNYDLCIEEAFRAAKKSLDVKWADVQIGTNAPNCETVLYKMHGDVTRSDEAVIYKEDYEYYAARHGAFQNTLNVDLLRKTFLFLGFSFDDPNVNYVLGHLRSLLDNDKRPQYAIMRYARKKKKDETEGDFEHRRTKRALQVDDLLRYGIETILVENYDQVGEILEALERRYWQRNIFLSGSTEPSNRDNLNLWTRLAERLIKENYNLICGFEPDVELSVVQEAVWILNQRRQSVDRRLRSPFPRRWSEPQRPDGRRESMISQSGFAIFIGGGEMEGALRDFEIAKKLKKTPIPLGATGPTAKKIWELVEENRKSFYPKTVKGEEFVDPFDWALFNTLNNPEAPNGDVLNAVFRIIYAVEAQTAVLPSEKSALTKFAELSKANPNDSPHLLRIKMKKRTGEVTFDQIDQQGDFDQIDQQD